ncbi:MAG TPA: AAA family ATPase [Anaerolineaceae bacterium]|nr:AAA family ATPase [Anaerolineaceae bacterium]
MAQNFKSIQEAIPQFDRKNIESHIQNGERERQEILKRFPISDWPSLPLEKYALGLPQSADSFCRWIEFNSPHLGSMRGGSAVKHIIYKHKNKPGWYFYPPTMKDENEAWDAIRGDFIKMFQLAKDGNWDQIDDLPYLLGARALKIKTLNVYFPNEIISVSSIYHIRHFLERLGAWKEDMSQWEAVKLNRLLLETMRSIPEIKDWSTAELERLLYFWADPRESRRIVKIAPGENAKYWEECLQNNYICVGWDDTGDLRDFESKEAFQEKFKEIFSTKYNGNNSIIQRKSKEVWTLLELEPGDIVVANQGMSKILAIGEVINPGYFWNPNRADHKHTVSIKWDTSFEQDISPQQKWVFSTVDTVSAALYQQIVTKKGKSSVKEIPVDEQFAQLEHSLQRKGQAILYGPPGTGKTYFARRFAVWWLLKDQNANRAQTVLGNSKQFETEERKLSISTSSQRVWWLVANPSEWSWEQLFKNKKESFRYGRFQRNYPLVQPGDLVIGYQARPDKKIVAIAKITKGLNEDEGGNPHIEIEPLLQIHNGPTYEEMTQDEILKNSEPIRNRCQGTLFMLTADESQYLFELIAENQPEIEKFITSGEGIGYLTWLTFHPSYSYEDFVEGFRPVETTSGLVLKLADGIFKRICREALAHPKQKYLVIIDEINRANLAKVLGELITLLERDKRGMQITLPQSKEPFTIPPNIYVLGTMNTADRSIKLLDVALRRRFAFFELMPDAELLEGTVINGLQLDALLETLNEKIAKSEGREKQIGHALFMSDGEPISEPEELADRFRQDVLPLLQEYCYDDYSALEKYLGTKIVNAEENSLNADLINNDTALIEALSDLVTNQD